MNLNYEKSNLKGRQITTLLLKNWRHNFTAKRASQTFCNIVSLA